MKAQSSSKERILSSDEENNSSFIASSFFQKKKNTYLNPLQRKDIRDRAASKGIILDKSLKETSPETEKLQAKGGKSKNAVKRPGGSVNKVNQAKRAKPLNTSKKIVTTKKTEQETLNLLNSITQSSPKKNIDSVDTKSPVKKSPKGKKSPNGKKSPRGKKSPNKTGLRRSPRKIAQKGIKLYVQNWKKQQKAGKKKSANSKVIKNKTKGEVNKGKTRGVIKPVVTGPEKRPGQVNSSGKASRGLDFGDENPPQLEDVVATEIEEIKIHPLENKVMEETDVNMIEDCHPIEDDRQSPKNQIITPLPQRKKRMKTGDECLIEDSPRPKRGKMESRISNEIEGFDWFCSPEKSSEDSPFDPTIDISPVIKKFSSPARKILKKDDTIFTSTPKLYPIFTPPTSPSSAGSATPGVKKITRLRSRKAAQVVTRKTSPKKSPSTRRNLRNKEGTDQMILDLGQKYFGAVTCETCGMVYTAAHPEDETNHDKFHRKFITSIKFNGWKNETVLEVFADGRIIMVDSDAPRYCIKKVEEIQELVDQELGFLEGNNLAGKELCKTLLFVGDDKKVAGCLIAENINYGYRVIPDDESQSTDKASQESHKAWCCESKKVPAVCGISRIWVAASWRRKKVATRLMDNLRRYYTYGTLLTKDNVAFSDPTPDGKLFATAYTTSNRFLVYKYK